MSTAAWEWAPDGQSLYYNANPSTAWADLRFTVGHHLVLSSRADTGTPNGLARVQQQPLPAASIKVNGTGDVVADVFGYFGR
ncbi:hypothetical protein [Kitasatospora mediocidica]|uniref:hypothetical protein n=1 Tax=Kitasatospora mediocidica TaxID=58352 RepID=UPI00056B042B|nr:hypothetical protein [Kitasatospora mediocidica]